MAPNVPAMLEAHYGVPMAGAVLNPLNYRLDPRSVAFILEHGEAKLLIADTEFSDTIKEVREGRLSDPLDEYNHYLVAEQEGRIAGFISVTPPGSRYAFDKYFERSALPFPVDDGLFELRLLTIHAIPDAARSGGKTRASRAQGARTCGRRRSSEE